MYITVLSLSALICTLCSAFHPSHSTANVVERSRGPNLLRDQSMTMTSQEPDTDKQGARVAFVGNSIIYFNDSPRFLVNLGKGSVEHQDSCLRGGTNLAQLWDQGNGMRFHGFATEAAKIGDQYDVGSPTVKDLLGCTPAGERRNWDYVVMNDHTQGPARPESRKVAQETLLENYLPLILENEATPVIIETAAYRYPGMNNSKDLGSTHEFQRRVREGVASYAQVLREKIQSQSCQPKIAPVGSAFLHVHDDNHALWEKLFDPDNFHPSPSGTFLQGCVLHCTLFGCPPPLPSTEEEIAHLWKDARVMHGAKREEKIPLPTVKDVEYLWNVAKTICC